MMALAKATIRLLCDLRDPGVKNLGAQNEKQRLL
ncbi:hypothetical protein LINPERPRIM_LOCUS23454 [Linum perenne]